MNESEHKDTGWSSGWISGWTLSAPFAALARETASPLEVVLSETPSALLLRTPGIDVSLELQFAANAGCRICSLGVRLTGRSGDTDTFASCAMLDANTLGIQADPKVFESILEDPGFEHQKDESFLYIGEGQHHLAYLVDRLSSPWRLIVIAGTGQPDTLRFRARSHIATDIHRNLDGALAKIAPGDETATAAEYLKSRLRAATPRVPYPWLCGDDGEPVWDLRILYPAFCGLLTTVPDAATGLIKNLLEMMDSSGRLPIAGGSISPPFNGPTSCPVLARMFLECYLSNGYWPLELDRSLGRLAGHLESHIGPESDDDAGEKNGAFVAIVRSDIRCLTRIHRLTGRPIDERMRKLQDRLTTKDATREPTAGISDAVVAVLNAVHRRGRSGVLPELIDQSRRLLSSEDPRSIAGSLQNAMIAAEEIEAADYARYSQWVTDLNTAVQNAWRTFVRESADGQIPEHAPELLAMAGGLCWTNAAKLSAFDKRKLKQQSVVTFFNRRKKWFIGAGIAVIAALTAFIISVQLRTTMPKSIFETRFGTALQQYQTGLLDDALGTIADMEAGGAAGAPALIFLKGKIKFKKADYTAAIECFAECARRDPDTPGYRYNLALSHAKSGDTRAGMDIFADLERQYATTYPAIAARARTAYAVLEEMDKMKAAKASAE